MISRAQILKDLDNESGFLWGVRQSGKSTLLKAMFPNALYFDLLLHEEFNRFTSNPGVLRQFTEAYHGRGPVIIDEIQRIPALLNEVQWLMVNKGLRFILSGSSPRKILRYGGNLLGGRAIRYELYPLSYSEITRFDLVHALNFGLLPRHYLSVNPKRMINAYIGSFMKDEIAVEAKIRNLSNFSRFLEVSAFSNGEMVNYANIATDCGISAPTVKEYFQILEDTLTGRFLPSYQKKPKRRVIQASKFYLFDVGIANGLLNRGRLVPGNELWGKAFEHFIFHELICHRHYSGLDYPIAYWRTASQYEVDFILGDHEVAIEVKATDHAHSRHFKGLKAFAEEYQTKRNIVVCQEKYPRREGLIEVYPWQHFLNELWNGHIIH